MSKFTVSISAGRPYKPIVNAAAFAVLLALAFATTSCSGASTDSEGRTLPSDAEVIADVTPDDTENVVSVEVVPGKSGEAYLHENDLAWYFDRGVVVKRKAPLDGAPNAVVAVGGLARYVWTGSGYQYSRFLTTYNEYEGIPAPDDDELLDYVNDHLADVFQSRDHTIVEISSVKLADSPRKWHSVTSFTVPFRISYKYIKNNN